MYVKVYISGMEMSQGIHFWYQILLKCWFFEKIAKKSLFWSKNFCDKLKKKIELKKLKLLENQFKTQLLERFFHIFELGNILKIFDQKSNK